MNISVVNLLNYDKISDPIVIYLLFTAVYVFDEHLKYDAQNIVH